MFCRLRFKCRCLLDFLRFWMPFGGPLCTISQKTKNGSENSFKKGAPYIKTRHYEHIWGLPKELPRVRTSRTRNNSSSWKSCSNLFPLFFARILFENAVWLGFNCKSFKQHVRKDEKNRRRKHIVRDLTRLGPRPGEFSVFFVSSVL